MRTRRRPGRSFPRGRKETRKGESPVPVSKPCLGWPPAREISASTNRFRFVLGNFPLVYCLFFRATGVFREGLPRAARRGGDQGRGNVRSGFVSRNLHGRRGDKRPNALFGEGRRVAVNADPTPVALDVHFGGRDQDPVRSVVAAELPGFFLRR